MTSVVRNVFIDSEDHGCPASLANLTLHLGRKRQMKSFFNVEVVADTPLSSQYSPVSIPGPHEPELQTHFTDMARADNQHRVLNIK